MNNEQKQIKPTGIKLGLRLKIVSIMGIFIFIMAVSVIMFFTQQQKDIFIAGAEKWGVSLALNLAYNSEYGVLVKDKLILNQLLDSVSKEKDVLCVSIYDLQGEEITNYHQVKVGISQYCKNFERDDKNWLRQRDYVYKIESEILKIALPIKTFQEVQADKEFLLEEESKPNTSKTQSIGYIKMEISLKNTLADLSRTRNMSVLIICFISIIFGFVLADFLDETVIKPITTLAHGAKVMAQGDYHQHIEIKYQDEIGQLAYVFNDMAREMEKSHSEIVNKVAELEKANKELKDAQDQLIQAGKLSALGQLAAGVSHELKNPLGGILGYAQFILEKVERKGVENLVQQDIKSFVTYVGHILKSALRCTSIIKSLLKFSRKSDNEAEQQELIDIQETLEETFIFTQHQLEINQIELTKAFTPNLPKILGNKQQLQQVFVNMIVNAQQAMKNGGNLTVVTFAESSNGDGVPSWLVAQFIDTGSGIDPKNLKKIFDPFFTTKPLGEGTGLGLSLSYNIIKDHSGEISVQSEPGKGTTFTVRLPVADENKIAALKMIAVQNNNQDKMLQ